MNDRIRRTLRASVACQYGLDGVIGEQRRTFDTIPGRHREWGLRFILDGLARWPVVSPGGGRKGGRKGGRGGGHVTRTCRIYSKSIRITRWGDTTM